MDQVGEQKEVGSPILLAIHSLLATFDLQGFQKTFLVVEVQSLDHSLDIWIDSQKIVVLQSGDFWNVVVASLSKKYFVNICMTHLYDSIQTSHFNFLPFFFLKLDRDTTDWTGSDSLHQVSDETSNLVTKTLGWDDCNFYKNK